MNLIQVLLPVFDNKGQRFAQDLHETVRQELVERFGGMTAYNRAPAIGLWAQAGDVLRDDIVVYEVMAKAPDRLWWIKYRKELERRFQQEQLVVRSTRIELL